jgi:O-antigen/teichoic acid export membrane protein
VNRKKNATRNIIFGTCLKLYQIVVPFLMRTIMIYFMGVQYLGLNSLFTSVLQVLNLAELGVGSAMVYSMYKPIAEHDSDTICALMGLYRKYYRIIGMVVLVAGSILIPFVPHLIKSDVPDGINIYVLYIMNLLATVFTYWLYAYKNSILQAYQRTDVVSKVTMITDTIKYALQILVIIFLKNYYIYVLILIVLQIVANISTAFVVSKMYPEYECKGELPKEEVKQINLRIKDLFTSKIGAVIVNSADTVVISAFLGLTMLAIYQNYFFIISSVIAIIAVVFNSCTAGIGNSIIVETTEKNYNDFKKFTFLIAWLAGFCTVCILCLMQPFMNIWMNGNSELMLGMSEVICFCVYFFVYEIQQLLLTYKDAAGMWHEDKFRPLVTALTNLALNIIMVQFWGLYGVLLSTVISIILIGMPWLFYNLFTVLFKRNAFKYVIRIVYYTIVTIVVSVVTYYICSFVAIGGILEFIIKLVICIIVPNILFFVFLFKLNEFKEVKKLIIGMLKR